MILQRVSVVVAFASIAAAMPMVGCKKAAPPKVDAPMTLAEAMKYVDPDLRWTPPRIKPEQNGWELMEIAAKVIPQTSSAPLPGPRGLPKSKSGPENPGDLLGLIDDPTEPNILQRCQTTIQAFRNPLDAIRDAAKRPYWYAPSPDMDRVPSPLAAAPDTSFRLYAGVKNLSKTLVLSAQVNLKLTKPKEAADNLILCHVLADRLVESHKDLITLLVGYAVEAIADKSIQGLCADPAFRVQDLQRILSQIREREMAFDLVESLKSEHCREFVALVAYYPSTNLGFRYGKDPDIAATLLDGHPYPLNRKATIELGGKLLKRIVEQAKQPYGRKENIENLGADLLNGWPPGFLDQTEEVEEKELTRSEIRSYQSALAKIDNPVGKILVHLSVPVFVEADQSAAKAAANSRITKIILAAQILRRQTGKYPATLADLVAKGILKAVPLDPFSGEPFRYDPARKVVWSVGKNLKDDGGRDPVGSPNGKDLVWPIDGRFPKRAAAKITVPPAGMGSMGSPLGAPPMAK